MTNLSVINTIPNALSSFFMHSLLTLFLVVFIVCFFQLLFLFLIS